jgi:hypothetical protein
MCLLKKKKKEKKKKKMMILTQILTSIVYTSQIALGFVRTSSTLIQVLQNSHVPALCQLPPEVPM